MNQSAQTIDPPKEARGFLEAARELGPLIREHAPQAERDRKLSPAVLEAMADAGLQSLYVPESLGGGEVDPVTYARVAETIAGFDSAAGWALQAGNSMAWWAARLPDEGAEEIYAHGPTALIAGAFHPPLPTTEVEGGFRVTGRAPLASNIRDADHVFLSGIVMDGDEPKMEGGAPLLVQLILRPDQIQVIDTWHALGMRGTDSNDVAVEDAFVPEARTFPIVPDFAPGRHYQGPLYRFPGVGILVTIFAPVMLAVGRAAIAEFRKLALEKTPFGSKVTLRERPSTQEALARSEATLRAARALFYETVESAWNRTLAGRSASLDEKADLLLAGAHVATAMVEVTDRMHRLAGTSGIYAGSPLERHFRDAQTLRQHGFTSESRYQTAGQVQLGVSPEFALVHF